MTPPPRERWTPAYDRMFKMDHELAYGPTCPRFAWLDLCHNARWEDGTRIVDGVVIPLKRGEVLASLRWMAQRWEWSVKKVRSFVNLLTHPDVAKLEVIRETPQGTVYRIVNYDTYANPGHTAGHSKGHDRGTPGAHPGHKEQQGTSGFIKEDDSAFAWDEFTIKSLRSMYGWQGSEGTDLLLIKAFEDPDERDRCLTNAINRMQAERKPYANGRYFRSVLEAVVQEQSAAGGFWSQSKPTRYA